MLAIVTGGFAVDAVAAVGPQQRTDLVSAVPAGNRLGVPYERTCAGDDGQYRQVVITGNAVTNIKGLVTGLVRARGQQTGGRLVANFVSISVGTSIYGGIGGTGTNTMPTVIQSGRCPFVDSK